MIQKQQWREICEYRWGLHNPIWQIDTEVRRPSLRQK